MKHPPWLTELHKQWMKARERRTDSLTRAFRRDWEKLLDDAGIHSAEERQAAQREAEKLPQVHLFPVKKRPRLIDKIELPLESESWLHDHFGTQAGTALRARSLEIIADFANRSFPLMTEQWQSLLTSIETAFTASKSMGPFSWMEPDRLELHLSLLWDITSREWLHGTLIRDASTAIGRDSKMLETHERSLTRGLELLMGEETPFEAFGIQASNSVLHFSGPLTLHFKGHEKVVDLRFESTLSISEFKDITHITTTAHRLLTVENHKTTFLQLARADVAQQTLIVATSFPTRAVCSLLEKLPLQLPHYHFGDTDPCGWDILRRIREMSPRPVMPHQMNWRPSDGANSFTIQQKKVLARLLADPKMSDCHEPMNQMLKAGNRGNFEQESLGTPRLLGWPFY